MLLAQKTHRRVANSFPGPAGLGQLEMNTGSGQINLNDMHPHTSRSVFGSRDRRHPDERATDRLGAVQWGK